MAYIQSCWYFQPSFVICILSPVAPLPFSLVQLSPLSPLPCVSKYSILYNTRIQCVRGGGGYGDLGGQINICCQVLLEVNFLVDDIFKCIFRVLPFCGQWYLCISYTKCYYWWHIVKKRPNAKGAGSHWLAWEPRNVMTTFKDNLFVNRVESFVWA